MYFHDRCRSLLVVAILCGALFSSQSSAADIPASPTDVLQQVQATYGSLQSYSAMGEITSTFSSSGLPPHESNHAFTILLARPDLYRIEWEQRRPNFIAKGMAWSAGDGHFVLIPGEATGQQVRDLSVALAMATGISGGAASTIPGAFFALDLSPFKMIKNAAFTQEEAIEGDLCYVITGHVAKQDTTLWISKKSKLLRQIRRDYNGPMEVPELSDEDVKKSLESMNRETTAEAIATMKEQLQTARKMMSGGMSGFSMEKHREIKVNPHVSKADFGRPAS